MKFGYLQVYNEVDWIGYQIDMALRFCDKLLIIEGSQFTTYKEISERSNDGTLDIISDKMKQYNNIIIEKTIRKHSNYRLNQCDNFNKALEYCNIGDYFISLDCDEFYFDKHIKNINDIMNKNKADIIGSYGLTFGFGMNWQLFYNNQIIDGKKHIIKKTKSLYFIPTHKPRNCGNIEILNKDYIGRHHYKWCHSTKRLRDRHITSGFFPNMLQWFDENWSSIQLNNSTHKYYGGEFTLKEYKGNHPECLNDHHWINLNDIRLDNNRRRK